MKHEFVEIIPESLEQGVVYISLKYGIASHRCACGCGEEVVLKIAPEWWRLTYDGETVSFSPSVGNWNLKCKSHYWIFQNEIRWAEPWSNERIAAGRKRGTSNSAARHKKSDHGAADKAAETKDNESWTRRLIRRIRSSSHD